MKGLVFVGLCVAFVAVVLARPEGDDPFGTEFDDIDVEEIFNSGRLYKNYIRCFKTGEKCTPAGKKIKEILPDALQDECNTCTEAHRKQGRVVLRLILKDHPDDFLVLEKLYDPELKYRVKFADSLKKDGIALPARN